MYFVLLQVKDICNELEVRVLCHKILQNVSILLDADRGSLFLVQGERASPNPQNGRSVLHHIYIFFAYADVDFSIRTVS